MADIINFNQLMEKSKDQGVERIDNSDHVIDEFFESLSNCKRFKHAVGRPLMLKGDPSEAGYWLSKALEEFIVEGELK